MSPKRTHRVHRNQLLDNTLVKSKGVTTGTNVNSNGHNILRKRNRNIEFKDREEPARRQKNIVTKLKIVPTNDDSMNNRKQMNLHQSIDDSCFLNSDSKDTKGFDEFANSSGANLYSNKTPKKLKSLKQWSGKTRMNSYSSELLGSSPVVKNLRRNKIPKKSPIRMSPVKIHSIRPSRVFRTPKRSTLTVDSLSEFQGNEVLPNDNNMQLKLHVSDTDLNTSCKLSKRRTSTFAVKKSNKSTSMLSIGTKVKYGKQRFSKSTKSVLRYTKLKLRSKNSKASTIDYFPYKNTKLKEPIVLLQRLPNIVTVVPSSLPLSSSMVKICINDRFSDNNINVSRKVFDSAFNHSKEVLEKANDKRHTRTERYSNHEYKRDNMSQISSESLISSTPKDNETLNDSGNKCRRSAFKRNARNSQNDVIVTIENEQEEMKEKNVTYELIEPKTPNLRKQLQEKRDVEENNLNEKPAKKNVNVRFTSSDTNSNYNIRSCRRLNEKKLPDLENGISKASLKKNILRSTIGVSHRRLIRGKGTSAVDSFTHPQTSSKSATSFVNVNINTTPLLVPRRNRKFSSATKEVPNFAEIHKKMFAKLESIVDIKNRLKNRHATFVTPKIDNSAKKKINLNEGGNQLSKELNRETYDRLGFKMRKREATDCILRNNSLQSASRKQQGRAILKGVRTNRRFELQMKLRNMK